MALIGADIAQLRETINMLRQGHTQLNDAFLSAAQRMQALQSGPWSGQHRVQAEEAWEQLRSQFTPLANSLENLALRLERFADNLEEAGRVFGQASNFTFAGNSENQQSATTQSTGQGFNIHDWVNHSLSLGKEFIQRFDIDDWVNRGLSVGKDFIQRFDTYDWANLGLSVVKASIFAIEFSSKGPVQDRILESFGFTPDLRDIKTTSNGFFKDLVLKPSLKSMKSDVLGDIKESVQEVQTFFKDNPKTVPASFKHDLLSKRDLRSFTSGSWSLLGIAGSVVSILDLKSSVEENFANAENEFGNKPKAIAAATIDTAVEIAFSKGGQAIGSAAGGIILGSALGAVSGGVLAPFGTALGQAVGGVLGEKVGEWAAEEIQKQQWYKDARAQGAEHFADGVEAVEQWAQQAPETLSNVGNQANILIRDGVNSLLSLVK